MDKTINKTASKRNDLLPPTPKQQQKIKKIKQKPKTQRQQKNPMNG